jgi:hypothetical protein
MRRILMLSCSFNIQCHFRTRQHGIPFGMGVPSDFAALRSICSFSRALLSRPAFSSVDRYEHFDQSNSRFDDISRLVLPSSRPDMTKVSIDPSRSTYYAIRRLPTILIDLSDLPLEPLRQPFDVPLDLPGASFRVIPYPFS